MPLGEKDVKMVEAKACVVWQQKLQQVNEDIQVHALAPGIYTLMIIDNIKKVHSLQFDKK